MHNAYDFFIDFLCNLLYNIPTENFIYKYININLEDIMNKKADKFDTQEIKIAKTLDDYGDNFDNFDNFTEKKSNINNSKEFYKRKKSTIIFSIVIIAFSCFALYIALSNYIPSSDNSKKILKDSKQYFSTTTTSYKDKTLDEFNKKVISKNNDKVYTYCETTTLNTTKGSQSFTETLTSNQGEFETEKILPTTINKKVETTSQIISTLPSKVFEIEDITAVKDQDKIVNINVSGKFMGYSEDEILSQISINTSTGSPTVFSPILKDDNNFSFNINIEKCTGQLEITSQNFYFYQSIESFY